MAFQVLSFFRNKGPFSFGSGCSISMGLSPPGVVFLRSLLAYLLGGLSVDPCGCVSALCLQHLPRAGVQGNG